MNKRQYLYKIIELCTPDQLELFDRMYPNGVSSNDMLNATSQVENTLKKANVNTEALKYVKMEVKSLDDEHSNKIGKLKQEIETLKSELAGSVKLVKRLSNPISIENNNVQEQLNKLYALEAGGVDNWVGYDESLAEFND